MAYSRRCSICATNWPYLSAYTTCPICDEDTWFQSDGVDPLTQLEAQQIIAAHEPEPEIRRRTESEVKMDRAFDAWFLRELVQRLDAVLAGVGTCPLCEL